MSRISFFSRNCFAKTHAFKIAWFLHLLSFASRLLDKPCEIHFNNDLSFWPSFSLKLHYVSLQQCVWPLRTKSTAVRGESEYVQHTSKSSNIVTCCFCSIIVFPLFNFFWPSDLVESAQSLTSSFDRLSLFIFLGRGFYY